jgi:hypothetical protein
MANLTANANVSGRLEGRTAEIVIASSNTIYEGALVVVNASGLAISNPADTTNFRFMGVAIKGGVGDGTSVTCVVERRGTRIFPKASAAQADIGKLAHVLAGDNINKETIPLRNAMNEVLRDDYVRDCESVVSKWNAETREQGIDFQFKLPSRRFHRKVGQWSEAKFDVAGNLVSEAEWDRLRDTWLPTDAERNYVQSLMKQVIEPGKMANWIAPPARGVNDQPVEYVYVKL